MGSEFFSRPLLTFKNVKGLSSGLLQQFYRAEVLHDNFLNENMKDVVLYSYWFDRWVTILGVLKLQQKISSFISRAHAFDLYEEDNINGIINFRKFQLKTITKVFAVSKDGADYLSRKYPNHISKFEYAWLGSKSHLNYNPFSPDMLTIVSCGSVQDRKRIKEIPAILKNIKVSYKWVHFGDGNEMELLKSNIKVKKTQENVELKGHVPNYQFIEYLKSHPITFFFSISRNEGLPFTMLEAISYGIPIIATDAMGCRELVNEQTGVLIPINFTAEKLASQIEAFYQSDMNTERFRAGVKRFWKEHFEAEKNYMEFYKKIEND